MGLDLYSTEDGAPIAIEYQPAVTRGLTSWFAPAVSPEISTRNYYLDGGTEAQVEGTLTYADGFAHFTTALNYIQTDADETEALSMMIVARSSATFVDPANRPMLAGNLLSSAGQAGVGMLFRNDQTALPAPAAQLAFYAWSDLAGVPSSLLATATISDATQWAAYHGVVDGTRVAARNWRDGTFGSRAPGQSRRLNMATPLRIGDSPWPGYGGQCDIALAVFHNVGLTDQELSDQHASAKAFLQAVRGITID